jgi:predicted nuclease of restriction endonuclease-like (RecB) superfamily
MFAIPQRPVAELPETTLPDKIRSRPVAEFFPNDLEKPAQVSGETQIVQRVVAQLPWAHNVILIQKLKDLPTRLWYARQAIAQGWSRDTLALMIKSHTHDRQGATVTNFDMRLLQPHAQLAKDTLKDPYIFDFLTLDKPIGISEYELTRALPEELKSALPTIEEIEAELSADLHDENEGEV